MRANSQPRRDIAKTPVGRRLRSIEHQEAQEPAMRLVLTAARPFNEHGIHATRLDPIIAEAGGGRRDFYKDFRSKEGFGRAVLWQEKKAWVEEDGGTAMVTRNPRTARSAAKAALALMDAADL